MKTELDISKQERTTVDELLKELEEITELKLKKTKGDKGRNKVIKESQNLKQIVLKHPLLFSKSFEAGTLEVEPVT